MVKGNKIEDKNRNHIKNRQEKKMFKSTSSLHKRSNSKVAVDLLLLAEENEDYEIEEEEEENEDLQIEEESDSDLLGSELSKSFASLLNQFESNVRHSF